MIVATTAVSRGERRRRTAARGVGVVCTGGAFLIAVRDANPDEGGDGVTGTGPSRPRPVDLDGRWSRCEPQAFRLTTSKVAYGCGSVPESDRLPLALAVVVRLPEQEDRR